MLTNPLRSATTFWQSVFQTVSQASMIWSQLRRKTLRGGLNMACSRVKRKQGLNPKMQTTLSCLVFLIRMSCIQLSSSQQCPHVAILLACRQFLLHLTALWSLRVGEMYSVSCKEAWFFGAFRRASSYGKRNHYLLSNFVVQSIIYIIFRYRRIQPYCCNLCWVLVAKEVFELYWRG